MGHLGNGPVARAEATWPVAGPSIGQVRQQVPLTGRTELHSCHNCAMEWLITIYNSINSVPLGKPTTRKVLSFQKGSTMSLYLGVKPMEVNMPHLCKFWVCEYICNG